MTGTTLWASLLILTICCMTFLTQCAKAPSKAAKGNKVNSTVVEKKETNAENAEVLEEKVDLAASKTTKDLNITGARYMVQLEAEADIEVLVKGWSAYNTQLIKQVSKRAHIWLIALDPGDKTNEQILAYLKGTEGVKIVQTDKPVSPRED